MKISKKILKEINTPQTRIALAQVLGVTEQTIIRYIKTGDDNLTKAAAIGIIIENADERKGAFHRKKIEEIIQNINLYEETY